MLSDTISKIEAKLQSPSGSGVNEQTRAELLQLISELKREIATVDEEQALNITGFTRESTEHATGEAPNPELLKRSLAELAASVDGFEKSHPGLVQVVNRICTTLSNIGI
jgi:hypothetical protein